MRRYTVAGRGRTWTDLGGDCGSAPKRGGIRILISLGLSRHSFRKQVSSRVPPEQKTARLPPLLVPLWLQILDANPVLGANEILSDEGLKRARFGQIPRLTRLDPDVLESRAMRTILWHPTYVVALALAASKSRVRPAALPGCVLGSLDFADAAAFMTSILTDYQSLKEIVIMRPRPKMGSTDTLQEADSKATDQRRKVRSLRLLGFPF